MLQCLATLTLAFLFNSHALAQTSAEEAPPSPVAPAPVKQKLTKPLNFLVTDHEVKVKNPLLQYDLKKTDGKSLEIGSEVFDNESFTAKLEGGTLNFKWNSRLIETGEITIIDEQGNELWNFEATTAGAASFSDLSSSKAPRWQNGSAFRFCLRSDIGNGFTSMCTQLYAVEIKGTDIQLGLARSTGSARIILQNEEKKLSGAEEVTVGSPVQFLATLSSNASYEFLSEPHPLLIKDLVVSEKSKDAVTVTAVAPRPINLESELIEGISYNKFTKILGFENTMHLRPDLWRGDVKIKDAKIVLPGKSGGAFSYELEITDPPEAKDRRFVSEKVISGTYRSKEKIVVSDSEGNAQDWEFEVPKEFGLNTVSLEVPGKKMTHKPYLEIYRGSAGQASLRLTGISSASGFLILSEGHVAYWFNDIAGLDSYYFSKQRWGVSARYFFSLNKLPASTEDQTSDIDLKTMDFDLRYRLNPGLWEKDETVGLIAAYESLQFGTYSIPKMGVGAFWARSMPRSIDYWFSKLPFMNYPKWLDMEFIQYVSSLDSKFNLGSDYVLNFHGKVLWTPTFFGEAGFGVKSYYFESATTGEGAKLTTFFGTVGLGVNF
ncbi:hypothetical protein [Bdellovibrio reynosensis]|uniref:Uncharacterized protein n=1 Tax=Bdellovibrio reynosensis TaxID=2835041 RepID=A0ABY4C7X9_9BACT|nr:hypothetical protein [Bdellovibrio reynosensis]UOF00569.1 hypothetical protein MNR06_12755 [Bdellovibrio reynosensis]